MYKNSKLLFTFVLWIVFTESSGESESSDDSDIEGETASALFMVVRMRGAEKLPVFLVFLMNCL